MLYFRSGGRCAICKEVVYDPDGDGGKGITYEEIAHIEGLNPGSARYNPAMTPEERNSIDNLILLCPTHHAVIDKDIKTYTVDELKTLKRNHQEWIDSQLSLNLINVTFTELDGVIHFLKDNYEYNVRTDYNIMPVKDKIKKNELGPSVEALISRGLLQVKQVKDYINRHPDVDMGHRLRNAFVEKYNTLRNEGSHGDALFYEMYDFATDGKKDDLLYMAGGLSVLVYFFESCEVFEK